MPAVKISIAVSQMDCVVGEVQPNLDKIASMARQAKSLGADIVVFPECATTGYFIGDKIGKLAEAPGGPQSQALGAIAKANGLHLACGLYTTENGAISNSQQLFAPDGRMLANYRKVHLFAAERTVYQAGDRPMVVDTALGKLGMTICYDLIFPEYIQRLVALGANIVINSTNWINDPYQRDTWAWGGERTTGLVATRALENVIVLGMANRVGHEVAAPGLTFDSFGHSCVAGPSGRILAQITGGEGVAVAHIDIPAADYDRWTSIATYRIDHRPDVYKGG
ncbi:MAG: carbon-nitrogen hydrolase family protein [Alphaproteobacteria bacterium]|nr:carbon-nitrogen hydrolase family protein [Alphaproteobacteria bacterium]